MSSSNSDRGSTPIFDPAFESSGPATKPVPRRHAEPPAPIPYRSNCEGPSAPVDIPPLPQSLMTVEDIGGMHFVRIDVPAVRERQAYALTEPLCDLADRTNGKLTLDLSKVAAFSCAWINALIAVSKRCKGKGGNLVLAGVSTPCEQMLRQMGLHKQFTIVRAAA